MDTLDLKKPGSTSTTMPRGPQMEALFVLTCDTPDCGKRTEGHETGPLIAKAEAQGITDHAEIHEYVAKEVRLISRSQGWSSVSNGLTTQDHCPEHTGVVSARRVGRIVTP